MSTDMATPDSDSSVDIPNVFEYASSIRVAAYITDKHQDARNDISILRKPVINVSIGEPPVPDPQVYNSKHTMPITKDPR
jgi:hypothetical protein